MRGSKDSSPTDVAALSWEWAGNSQASFPFYFHPGQAQPGTGSDCRPPVGTGAGVGSDGS